MDDLLEMNVTARLMMLLAQLGVRDARRLAVYRGAVSAALRQQLGLAPAPGGSAIEPILGEQLALLETALRGRAAAGERLQRPEVARPAAEAADQPVQPVSEGCRRHRTAAGHAPEVRSMEEKLKEGREPVQKLLLEDCVGAGLLDVPKARQLIAGMTGKTNRDAEHEIVEYLRQVLQQQVKAFIRGAKGGPWADPHAQQDLRQDIHAANSVRAVLTLRRQVLSEYHCWEQENGRVGILGLFSARRRPPGH